MLRLLLFILTFALSVWAAVQYAESRPALVAHTEAVQIETDYRLKRILEKVGPSLLKAVVINHDGQEQNLFITRDDAVEIKRGLWIIRPGIYKTEI